MRGTRVEDSVADSPWDAPDPVGLTWDEVPTPRPDTLARVTGILNLVFAPLELLFALFAVAVLLSGGLVVSLPNPPPGLDDFMVLYFVVYALFLVGAVVAGLGHLVAGIQLLRARPNRVALWVSVFTSFGGLITVYCAPFGIASAILTLVWLTRPPPEEADG